METLAKPRVIVKYDGKDITADISRNMLAVTYTDKEEGEADELTITVEDIDGLWSGAWYPAKGAKLTAQLGKGQTLIDCGTFEIDEIELSGPPDTVTLRALAAPVTGKLRTKRSAAYESTTLAQIAQAIAGRNGLTVEGKIEELQFTRVTQNRETDLGFLHRLAAEYGYLFSVRDKKLIFTTVYDLEASDAVRVIDRSDLISYSIKDKTSETYKTAAVKYRDPVNNTVVNGTATADSDTTKGDQLTINSKSENAKQAELKAKAGLHRANSRQQEGTISLPGEILLLAGNNFELTGLGGLSGKYHIIASTHTVDKSGGYVTDLEIKRVGYVEEVKKKRKPAKKIRLIE